MIVPRSPAEDDGRCDQRIIEEAARDRFRDLRGAIDVPPDSVHSGNDHRHGGRSAPVVIGPAIALALSWKPLVKSKINATPLTVMVTKSAETAVPHPERLVWGVGDTWE